MELSGARILIAGGSGEIGGALATELRRRGASLALAGRDADRLSVAAEGAPALRFDLRDPASCARLIGDAADALGGLDGLVIATGAVAFGPAAELDVEVARELIEVNLLGPQALIAAALARMTDGGAICALSAIVADYPTAGMAAYSASKAALSAHLAATRREVRRQGVEVLDVRPPHLDTGFSGRALAGQAPELPDPYPVAELVPAICDALADGRRELAWDLKERAFV